MAALKRLKLLKEHVMTKKNHPVKIVDRPCGSGKTTKMIEGFCPQRRYLVVTPLLTECDRIVDRARVRFVQPQISEGSHRHETKRDHLIALLKAGSNVVTTHSMYNNLSDVARLGLLEGYDIIVDEVMSVVKSRHDIKKASWDRVYVGSGWVKVDPISGLITPTASWAECVADVDDTLRASLYHAAVAGRLYQVVGGAIVEVMPEILLTAGKSLTVYTYKAEGSMMLAYLKRIGLNPEHDKGSPEIEKAYVRKARDQIHIKDISAINRIKLSYTGQTKTDARVLDEKVCKALKSKRQNCLSNVPLADILITCPKEKWYLDGKAPVLDDNGSEQTPYRPGPYAKDSRIAPRGRNRSRATWIPNTTRGTNDYSHCTHAIYIYDQYMNPMIHQWLGGNEAISQDDYALTELIQWVWRTRIRRGEPITLYLPSQRMRELLLNWLWEDDVPTKVRDQISRTR